MIPLSPNDMAHLLADSIALADPNDEPGDHIVRGMCALICVDHGLAQRFIRSAATIRPEFAQRLHALVLAELEPAGV